MNNNNSSGSEEEDDLARVPEGKARIRVDGTMSNESSAADSSDESASDESSPSDDELKADSDDDEEESEEEESGEEFDLDTKRECFIAMHRHVICVSERISLPTIFLFLSYR